MTERLKALREQRASARDGMIALTEKAAAEKREMTAEEVSKHGELFAETERLRGLVSAEERSIEAARERADAELRQRDAAKDKAKGPEERTAAPGPRATPEYRKAYAAFLRRGHAEMTGDERRDLSVGTDTAGGYLVAPEQMVNALLKNVDDLVFIRNRATKYAVPQAQTLGVPTLTADPSDGEWVTELTTGTADTAMAFGKRALTPHYFAKKVLVSNELLRQSMIDAEGLVRDRIAYKMAITEEKTFLTGHGAQQPLGLFTASADGVPTTQDVSTGNTTSSITWDGLVEAKYKLKAQYWPKAAWLFHRDAVKQITKLKDGEGQYLWRMSVREGEPDTVLGAPLMMSENVPNTFTTGLYVGMFGDFSNYWIADAYDVQIQRLVELYAATNQVGFHVRAAVDGAPVLAEAFARVKLA